MLPAEGGHTITRRARRRGLLQACGPPRRWTPARCSAAVPPPRHLPCEEGEGPPHRVLLRSGSARMWEGRPLRPPTHPRRTSARFVWTVEWSSRQGLIWCDRVGSCRVGIGKVQMGRCVCFGLSCGLLYVWSRIRARKWQKIII